MFNIVAGVIWVSLPRSEGVNVIDGLLRQRLMQIFSLGRCEKKRQRNKQQRHNSRRSPRSVFLECHLKSQDFGILCSEVTRSVLCGIGFLFPKFGTNKKACHFVTSRQKREIAYTVNLKHDLNFANIICAWKSLKETKTKTWLGKTPYCVIFPRRANTGQPIQSSVVKARLVPSRSWGGFERESSSTFWPFRN